MRDVLAFTTHSVPALDTGIGIAAGYASDREFIAAMEAERAALPPVLRDALNAVDAALEHRILYGE